MHDEGLLEWIQNPTETSRCQATILADSLTPVVHSRAKEPKINWNGLFHHWSTVIEQKLFFLNKCFKHSQVVPQSFRERTKNSKSLCQTLLVRIGSPRSFKAYLELLLLNPKFSAHCFSWVKTWVQTALNHFFSSILCVMRISCGSSFPPHKNTCILNVFFCINLLWGLYIELVYI